MTAPDHEPICGPSCTPDCGMGHCYLTDGTYIDPEHAHKLNDQANEHAANELLTTPKLAADDLRQQLADAIRQAADTHEPACGDGDCECDLAILSPMFGNGPTTRVEGSPDGLAQVCAAVVQPVLDAKDAQIARLTRELTSLAQATHDLDQKAIDAYEERDAAQQRAEEAEREAARLRTHHQQIGDQ